MWLYMIHILVISAGALLIALCSRCWFVGMERGELNMGGNDNPESICSK